MVSPWNILAVTVWFTFPLLCIKLPQSYWLTAVKIQAPHSPVGWLWQLDCVGRFKMILLTWGIGAACWLEGFRSPPHGLSPSSRLDLLPYMMVSGQRFWSRLWKSNNVISTTFCWSKEDSGNGGTDFTSWWEEQHTGAKVGATLVGTFAENLPYPFAPVSIPDSKWMCEWVLPGRTQLPASPFLPQFSQSHWHFHLLSFFPPPSTLCLFTPIPHTHLWLRVRMIIPSKHIIPNWYFYNVFLKYKFILIGG